MAFDALRIPCTDTLLHAGVNDSFGTANGIEPTTQSPGLLALIQAAGQTPANFDQTAIDKLFGQTFTLPQGKCLVAAKVLLRVRPIASSIAPGSQERRAPTGLRQSRRSVRRTAVDGLLRHRHREHRPAAVAGPAVDRRATTRRPGSPSCSNLASLPGGTNLLPALDAQRFLDVYMQDDSSVDYVDLVYRLCNCPQPTPTPSQTPTPTPSPSPGPCSVTICKQTTPAGGTGFSFSSGFSGLQGITLNDGQCVQKPVACGFDLRRVRGPPVRARRCRTSPAPSVPAPAPSASSAPPSAPPAASSPATNRCSSTSTPVPRCSACSPTAPSDADRDGDGDGARDQHADAQADGDPDADGIRHRDPHQHRDADEHPDAERAPRPRRPPPPRSAPSPASRRRRTWWRGGRSTRRPAPPPWSTSPRRPPTTVCPSRGRSRCSRPRAPGPRASPATSSPRPADGALFFYTPATYVEVPHSTDLNLANSDLTIDAWVKPLPGPWSAGRDNLHVYPIVDKLNLAANSGYAFFLRVRTSCPTCSPQPPPSGAASTTEFRLALALGNGSAVTIYLSAPIYSGSGTVFPSPTPPSLLTPQPPGWTARHGDGRSQSEPSASSISTAVTSPAATSTPSPASTTPRRCGSAARVCTAPRRLPASSSSRSTRSRSSTSRSHKRTSRRSPPALAASASPPRRQPPRRRGPRRRHLHAHAHRRLDSDRDPDRNGDADELAHGHPNIDTNAEQNVQQHRDGDVHHAAHGHGGLVDRRQYDTPT